MYLVFVLPTLAQRVLTSRHLKALPWYLSFELNWCCGLFRYAEFRMYSKFQCLLLFPSHETIHWDYHCMFANIFCFGLYWPLQDTP